MTDPTQIVIQARAAKISIPIADADFPVAAIPPKGAPGTAKLRVRLQLRTPEGIELIAEAGAKSLQKALEAAAVAPGGFWIAQGRLMQFGKLAEAGIVYQPPRSTTEP